MAQGLTQAHRGFVAARLAAAFGEIAMSRRSVLVLGATGRLGTAAVAAFAAAGWRVLAQSRRAPGSLPDGATGLDVALEDGETLAARAAGVGVVVHAVNPPYAEWERRMLPLARRGLDVADRLGALFMLPGNVYGYGAGMPAVLREDTPERPTTGKGRLRVALEAEIRDRARSGGPRAVVLRAGDFYGAGRGSWFDLAVVRSLRAGKLVYPGPLDVPHPWAYLPDLARAFVAVAGRAGGGAPAPAFQSLHFAGHALTGAALLGLVQDAAGDIGLRPARGWRRGGMPWTLIRAMGVFAPGMRAIAEMSYLWRVPHALDGSLLSAQAGEPDETPPRLALRQALLDLGLGAGAPASAPPS